MTKDNIKQFTDWRPEFKDAKFICPEGVIQHNAVLSGGSGLKLKTKSEVGKMSKRYFNVVNPDDVVQKYGADCFRMYEMFLGPIEQSKPWDTNGIDGVSKFLRKFWNLCHVEGKFIVSDDTPSKEELKVVHATIKKLSDDIERFSMNTTISAFMMCVNDLKRLECNKREVIHQLTRLLAPFAPFIAEEIWSKLGEKNSVHHSNYPVADEKYLIEDSVVYPICINGKKREEIEIDVNESQQNIEKAVLNLDSIQKWLEGKSPKKVIIVQGRMINIVI